jgi:hypothetical protein
VHGVAVAVSADGSLAAEPVVDAALLVTVPAVAAGGTAGTAAPLVDEADPPAPPDEPAAPAPCVRRTFTAALSGRVSATYVPLPVVEIT